MTESREPAMTPPPGLEYEMTFTERIEGPLGPTIRVEASGIRRQDQRTQFRTDDGTTILMRYDAAVIRGDETFARALEHGLPTGFADQYMCMTPQFEVGSDGYDWLTRSLFVARGRLAGPKRIEYHVYRVV